MVSVNTIDISHFQNPENFDYQAAKKAGIQSIIIRGSTALSLDDHAKEHIANAKKYGFHWHLYHDWEGNDGELDFAVKAAKQLGLSSDQYLFLDMEGTHSGNWSDIFESFRDKAAVDFKVGLYISESPYKQRFDDSKLQSEGVARWIANYNQEPEHYDIWQKSGAGSGGFGTYTGDVDRDVDKNNILVGGSSPITPSKPQTNAYTQIVLEPGYDTDSGEYGRGYSFDNGETFYVTDTTYGRKYRQNDADRLYPYLKKYFGSGSATGPITSSIDWADILDKPDIATQDDLKSIESATSTATTQTASAVSAASQAQITANTANSTATVAQSAASQAQSTADTANSAAQVAQNTANNAESRAESAYSLASTASSDAKAATQVSAITSGTLADLANKQGVYHYEIDFIPSDSPAYNWGMCDVVVSENYAKEVFTDTSTTDVYVRTRKSESWSEWRQITLWN
jgi:GH25 family lysozyme M1 (1,4-beta-N-acetylmuramidase)